jgi:hypothetical protein
MPPPGSGSLQPKVPLSFPAHLTRPGPDRKADAVRYSLSASVCCVGCCHPGPVPFVKVLILANPVGVLYSPVPLLWSEEAALDHFPLLACLGGIPM